MFTTLRRVVDERSTTIASVLSSDRPCHFGLQSDRVSARVWERFGKNGHGPSGATLIELWGVVEDAQEPSPEGWRNLDNYLDGCDYMLAPNELEGLTLMDTGELREHFNG